MGGVHRPGGKVRRIAGTALAVLMCAGAGAANKNGVSPSVVSLPSGPGSIQGLGGDFQTDLPSGTLSYSFGIEIPPGPADHAPGLSLEYDGGFGNGSLGYGWRIIVPKVERKTSRGTPRYVDGPNGIDDDRDGDVDEADEVDLFVDQEGSNLIPRADGFYFQSVEGDFVRYERAGDAWEGIRPNGTKIFLGEDASSRVLNPDTGDTFAWLASREVDVNGNTMVFTYTTFPGDADRAQVYLKKIEYGPGAPPWDNFHFVTFDYELRDDWFESVRGGFLMRTGRRLSRITVGTQGPALAGHVQGDFNGDGTNDNLNRRYELDYDAHDHWSLLSDITVVGADGASTLPGVHMEYRVCAPPDTLDVSNSVIGSTNAPRILFDSSSVEIADLNGDGLPDLLQTDPFVGPHRAYLNQGEQNASGAPRIEWAGGQTMGGDQRVWTLDLSTLTGPVVHLADLNSDSVSDLVYKSEDRVYFFPNEGTPEAPTWGTRREMAIHPGTSAPSSPFETPEMKTSDLNADKLFDLIQSISVGGLAQHKVWINLGGNRFSKPVVHTPPRGYMFSQTGVSLADFNGDGLDDLVRIQPSAMEVSPGIGYGRFADPVTVDLPDTLLAEFQISGAELRDITGDGLPELLIEGAASGQLWYWINNGNYTLDKKRVFTGLPTLISESADSRWADMNGNGTTDIVYADQLGADRLVTVDFGMLMDCAPATNLIARVDNGIGGIMTVTYGSSTSFLVADRAAGEPWPDPIPFGVDVVTSITTDNTLGDVTVKELGYHDGFFSFENRFFHGFAGADEVLVGDDTAPTLITRREFETGRDEFALRGKLLRERAETESGDVFYDQTIDWDLTTLYTGVDGRTSSLVTKSEETTTIIEKGAGAERTIETQFVFDDFGNLTEKREFGVVDGGNRGALNDERITRTQYAINEENWVIHTPVQQDVLDFSGTLIARSRIFYDDETFSGDNFGDVVFGAETMVRSWTNPAQEGAFIHSQRIKYDAFGNAITILDPLAEAPGGVINDEAGHYRSIGYDTRFRTFPVSETVHIGGGSDDLELSVRYDEGLGVIVESTNFNGHTTAYGYDAFGRIVETVRPGDGANFPTVEHEYLLAQAVNGGVVNAIETRLLDKAPGSAGAKRDHYQLSRAYVDGVGRTLMEKEEAAPGPVGDSRVAVLRARGLNARGETAFELRPYFAEVGAGSLDELLEFENIDAGGWSGLFHDDGALASFVLADAPKTVTEYDAQLRKATVTNPDGTVRRTDYEPLRSVRFDENDADPTSPFFDTPTVFVDDGLERLMAVIERPRLGDDGNAVNDPVEWTWRYGYRADGPLLRVEDAQGNIWKAEYDGLKRRTATLDTNRGITVNNYDAASNLVSRIDAKGQRSTFTYDGVNRLLTEDFQDESRAFSAGRSYDPSQPLSAANRPDVTYFYDDPAGTIDFGNGDDGAAINTKGQLAYVVDLSGEEHTSYDERGRVAWVVKQVSEQFDGLLRPFRTAMEYDSQDRVTRVAYPDGDFTELAYDDRGRLISASGGEGVNLNGTPFVIADVTYTPAGQRDEVVYGNGTATTYAYDIQGRLARLTGLAPDGVTPLIDYEYTYNPASYITSIADVRPGTAVADGSPRRNSQFFGLDDVYRLTGVDYSFDTNPTPTANDGAIDYRYDRVGNMLEKASDINQLERGVPVADIGTMQYGGAFGTSGREGGMSDAPGPQALTQAESDLGVREFGYDANGNLTNLDEFQLTWDFNDRIVRLENDDFRAVYTYDYAGVRAVKRIFDKGPLGNVSGQPSSTTLYAGKHFEVRDPEQPTKYVFDGDMRVAKVTGMLQPASKRVQWVRLHAGWNSVSPAVDTTTFAAQLGIGTNPDIEAAFAWDETNGDYKKLSGGSAVPAGSVLWIDAKKDTVIPIEGRAYSSTKAELSLKQGFVSLRAAQAVDVSASLKAAGGSIWAYDSASQEWRTRFFGELAPMSDMPDFVRAGQPLMANMKQDNVIKLPGPAQDIHYYHPDHVGSATVMTDAEGDLIRERLFYPYGAPRLETDGPSASGTMISPYSFGDKERDSESGLHYFGARYLAASLGRFLSVDPALGDISTDALRDPQTLHAYAYGRNNPIHYTDPDGRFVKAAITGDRRTVKIGEKRSEVLGDIRIGKPQRGRTVNALSDKEKKLLDQFGFEPSSTTLSDPSQVISQVVAQAEKIKERTSGKKDSKLDVDSFLKVLINKDPTDEDVLARISTDDEFGALFADDPRTEDGGLVTDAAIASVGALQNVLRSTDLTAKFRELSKFRDNSIDFSEFDNQKKEFIKNFLEDQDDKEDEEQEEEEEDKKKQDDE